MNLVDWACLRAGQRGRLRFGAKSPSQRMVPECAEALLGDTDSCRDPVW